MARERSSSIIYYGKINEELDVPSETWTHGHCAINCNDWKIIQIFYHGAVRLINQMWSGSYIFKAASRHTIGIVEYSPPPFDQANLELFRYEGEFKITSARAVDSMGVAIDINVVPYLDYSELLNTNAEDLTTKSEDLKYGYQLGRKFRKTKLLNPAVMTSMNTSDFKRDLYLDNELYKGDIDIYTDGTIMTKSNQILRREKVVGA
tara:strand:- start:1303 stop:1920 length:618 start_codon:yes stop_codon:yes gene_type:complete